MSLSTSFPCADLRDCSEFAVTLQAKPTRVVHGSLLLLTLLLLTAFGWAWWTRADLVVQASGRIRPTSPPTKVVCTVSRAHSRGSALRISSVHYQIGDKVGEGDTLVRLDTEQIDMEIAKCRRTLQAGKEELASLSLQLSLHEKQMKASTVKLESQRDQAIAEAKLERERQSADARLAQVEVDSTSIEVKRRRSLLKTKAVSEEEFSKCQVDHAAAVAKRDKAALPIDESKVKIAEQAIAVLELEGAAKREELTSKIQMKQAEVDSAQIELQNLELERRESVLVAPIDGIVSSGEIRAGDVLEPNKAVLEVCKTDGFCFEAIVPSSEMAHVKTGMRARVRLDAYDYQRYGTLTGTVRYVSPDSDATNQKTGISYLVRIALDEEKLTRGGVSVPVKLGLSGQVEVVSDSESLLRIFVKKIRQKISLG